MKRTKLVLGLGALLLAGAGAYASVATRTSTPVWYDNNGTPTQTVVDFDCTIGMPDCIGVDGPSEGKQLYNDQQLSDPLHRL